MLSASDILKRGWVFRDRIFIAALALSLLWHLFWIAAIKVVFIPKKVELAKFSKVSFLGSAPSGMAIEARIVSHDRSFLEEGHLEALKKFSAFTAPKTMLKKAVSSEGNKAFDRKIVPLIEKAFDGPKEEPQAADL